MVTQIEPVTPRHLFQDDFIFMTSTYSTDSSAIKLRKPFGKLKQWCSTIQIKIYSEILASLTSWPTSNCVKKNICRVPPLRTSWWWPHRNDSQNSLLIHEVCKYYWPSLCHYHDQSFNMIVFAWKDLGAWNTKWNVITTNTTDSNDHHVCIWRHPWHRGLDWTQLDDLATVETQLLVVLAANIQHIAPQPPFRLWAQALFHKGVYGRGRGPPPQWCWGSGHQGLCSCFQSTQRPLARPQSQVFTHCWRNTHTTKCGLCDLADLLGKWLRVSMMEV